MSNQKETKDSQKKDEQESDQIPRDKKKGFNQFTLKFYNQKLENQFVQKNTKLRQSQYLWLQLHVVISSIVLLCVDFSYLPLINIFLSLIVMALLYYLPNQYVKILCIIIVVYASISLSMLSESTDNKHRIFLNGQQMGLFYILSYESFVTETLGIIIGQIISIYFLQSYDRYVLNFLSLGCVYIIYRYIHSRGLRSLFIFKQKQKQIGTVIHKVMPIALFVTSFDFITHQISVQDMNVAGRNMLKTFGPKINELKEIFQQFKIKQQISSFANSNYSRKDNSFKGRPRTVSCDLFQFLLQKFVYIHKYNNFFQKKTYIFKEDQEDILNDCNQEEQKQFEKDFVKQDTQKMTQLDQQNIFRDDLTKSEQLNCYVIQDQSNETRYYSVKIIPTFIEQPSILLLIEDLKMRKQNKYFEKQQTKQSQIHNFFFSDIQQKIQKQMSYIIKNNLQWSKKMCIIIRNQLLSYYQSINQSFKLLAKAENFKLSQIQKYIQEYFPNVEVTFENEQLKEEEIVQDFHLVSYVLTCFFTSAEIYNNSLKKNLNSTQNNNSQQEQMDFTNIFSMQQFNQNMIASINPQSEANNSPRPRLNSFYENIVTLPNIVSSNTALNLANSANNLNFNSQAQINNAIIMNTQSNNPNNQFSTNINIPLNTNNQFQGNANNSYYPNSEKYINLNTNKNINPNSNSVINYDNSPNSNIYISKNNNQSNYKKQENQDKINIIVNQNQKSAFSNQMQSNEDNCLTINNKCEISAIEIQQDLKDMKDSNDDIQKIIKCHIVKKKQKLYESIVFCFENYTKENNYNLNYTDNQIINKWIYQQINKIIKYIGPCQIDQKQNSLQIEIFTNLTILQNNKKPETQLCINSQDQSNQQITLVNLKSAIQATTIFKNSKYQKSGTATFDGDQTNSCQKQNRKTGNSQQLIVNPQEKDFNSLTIIPSTFRENLLCTVRTQTTQRAKLSIDTDNIDAGTNQKAPSQQSQNGKYQINLSSEKGKNNPNYGVIKSDEHLRSACPKSSHITQNYHKIHMQKYGKLLSKEIENERIVEVSMTDSNNIPSRHRISTVTQKIDEAKSEGFPDSNIKRYVQTYQ
ncbi:transmembrane protein, putative (macronuclear) [Tetrahymena thermophila SB210]|uniref:Transmembrane protein, putative n=1 Tax=Tetrahymena thermophila (strain SB210) TaxID=312017 RepID=I7MCS6_TETTS|nr:transmembrane protein, putative [Tetrahymena thermophila SB210]EAR84848.2 transmembrane protein, putative [Tetrahymena thermophila SB210]|eukprot:XP_001032511.2 transmembrane protein, putative [Tetrahymena thermophila SB210]